MNAINYLAISVVNARSGQDGDPEELKLSTEEKEARDREAAFHLTPGSQKENYAPRARQCIPYR